MESANSVWLCDMTHQFNSSMVILAQPHEREDDVAALATQLKISPQRARTALEVSERAFPDVSRALV